MSSRTDILTVEAFSLIRNEESTFAEPFLPRTKLIWNHKNKFYSLNKSKCLEKSDLKQA